MPVAASHIPHIWNRGDVPIEMTHDWLRCCSHKNVMTAWVALRSEKPIGNNIVIIGGGSVGCETADFLVDAPNFRTLGGRKVTVLEMLDNIVSTDYTPARDALISRLNHIGVIIHTNTKVTDVTEDRIICDCVGDQLSLEGVDTIISAIGTKSYQPLVEDIEKMGILLQSDWRC